MTAQESLSWSIKVGACFVLVGAWLVSLSYIAYYNLAWQSNWPQVCAVAVFALAVNVGAAYWFREARGEHQAPAALSLMICRALMCFVGQFVVYMTLVAILYPQNCSFTLYKHGLKYNASIMPTMKTGESILAAPIASNTISVDCGVKICLPGVHQLVGGLQIGKHILADFLCTNGGREFFSVLGQATPLVFSLGFKTAMKGTDASRNPWLPMLALNMIDIQDFWALFLDDGIIKNYWGRDNCDNDQWGCSGKGRNTWWLIMCAFWTSSLATLFMLVNSVCIARGQQAETLPWAGVWECFNRQGGCHFRLMAFLNLLFLEFPFFFLRLFCSVKFDIVASTLLVKNLLGMLVTVSFLCIPGELSELETVPVIGGLLKSVLDVVYSRRDYTALPQGDQTHRSQKHAQKITPGGTCLSSLRAGLQSRNFAAAWLSLAALVLAWTRVLTKRLEMRLNATYHAKLDEWVISVAVTFAACVFNLFCVILFQSEYIWGKAASLSLFVCQFAAYLTLVAFFYPYGCDFTTYTEGFQYKGDNIANLSLNTTHVTRYSEISWDEEIKVDCEIEICLSWLRFLCTTGGRELFACLAHASPLVFMLGFSTAMDEELKKNALSIKGRLLSCAVLSLNMVDIQDFWALLLEDDLIKNFWGRDNCKTPEFLSVLGISWGCSGRTGYTWWFVMIAFWTSTLVTVVYLVNAVQIVMGNGPLKLPSDSATAETRRLTLLRCFVLAIGGLHELPFFVLRLWCSRVFDSIKLSTLVAKNFLGIGCMAIIFYWNGNMKEFRESWPTSAAFLHSLTSGFYTDQEAALVDPEGGTETGTEGLAER